MALDFWTRREIEREIDATSTEIQSALWAEPADLELVKTLISKRMGLRILADEVLIRLKPPPKIVDGTHSQPF